MVLYECRYCGLEGSRYVLIQHLLVDKAHEAVQALEAHWEKGK